ncbi:hypothetical protein [Raineya sp.]|jgi:uncharacterized protein YcfL
MKQLFAYLLLGLTLVACDRKNTAQKQELKENKTETTQKQSLIKSDSASVSNSEEEPKKTSETIEEEP